MFSNTDKFRQAAIFFEKNKCFTKYQRGTIPYKEFWEAEDLKCRYGVEIDGVRITGPHYFYLNYSQMLAKDEETNRKRMIFPRFLDIDYDYFHIVERAKIEKKGVILVKPRRTGFSYKNAALVTHEYNFYRDAKCIIGSFRSTLSENTMGMVLDNMNFLDKNTEWKKQRNPDTKEFVKARYKENIGGIEVWKGYNSQVQTLTFKDNPFASVGKSSNIFIFEEAGTFENLINSYNMTEPCWKDGEDMIGIPIVFGTGGDMEGGTRDFHQMFYDPDKYNLLSFDNIWEEGKEGTKCGWFVPSTRGRLGDYKGVPLVDKDGNSNEVFALESIRNLRTIKKGRSGNINDTITQYPLTPSEAFLRRKGNIFPTIELSEWLAEIETKERYRAMGKTGELYFDNENKIKFRLDGDLEPILNFPPKDGDNKDGCVVIYEEPEVFEGGIPYGLYIAGCLTPGEKVLTDKGLKSVQDVKLNDKLINKDGEEVDIINLQKYDKINEPTYKIKVSNTQRRTRFTKEHPIYISKPYYNSDKTLNVDKFNFNFKTVDKIKVGDWTKVPNIYTRIIKDDVILNHWKNTSRIDKQISNPLLNEDFWWIVGLWLGDGWCESNGYKVSICFNKKETKYIDKLIKISETIFKRHCDIRTRGNCVQVSFCFQELNTFLTTHFNKYSYSKNIPEWVKYLPEYLKKQLILGYLDSDGSIIKGNSYTTEFVSINLELLEGIQDMLFSMNIVSSLNKLRDAGTMKIINRYCETKPCYHLRLNYTDTIKFYNLYNNQQHNHKLSRINIKDIKNKRISKRDCFISEDNNYIYFKIKEIEKATYTGIVYNFECNTHTFMCHHITTHNCDPYDQDKSQTGSLGSFFVYKTFVTANKTSHIIVAEYTGRPEFADIFYENCRRLCMFYNAKCLYENQLKGFKVYFETKNSLHYLYQQPAIINDIVKDSRVNRGYGIHMNRGSGGNNGIKDQCEIYLKQWLLEERNGPDERKILNLHTIFSIPLLKELILYDRDGNFDRVIAFMLCILQSKENHKVHIEENQPTIVDFDPFFKRTHFKKYNTQD
jgi:intein/homing endonuclease